MLNKARKHLHENNMTYLQHLRFAATYSFICLCASLSLIIHAVFPCWLQTTGSDLVRTLSSVFRKHK